ncbi:MAG: aminoacyl-tRNA hydrolase [Dehalococcoidia bacterium]|nr:aminoacyl-tRNA hydrolase [Dehalococcoidia bacterium]
MKLIVGLGNPGKAYANTRHNVGAMCMQALAQRLDLTLQPKSRLAMLAQGSIGGHEVVLAVPRSYVNTSGDAVSGLLDRHDLSPKELVLVYDELALPLGSVRIRPFGSAGGHNGVKSVIATLGTESFARVRVGIGRPPEGSVDQVAYVLGQFKPAEHAILKGAIDEAADAITCLLTDGIMSAMNRFNRRQPIEEKGK